MKQKADSLYNQSCTLPQLSRHKLSNLYDMVLAHCVFGEVILHIPSRARFIILVENNERLHKLYSTPNMGIISKMKSLPRHTARNGAMRISRILAGKAEGKYRSEDTGTTG
jgi:hypothetical protein